MHSVDKSEDTFVQVHLLKKVIEHGVKIWLMEIDKFLVISLSWTHANSHNILKEDFCASRPCKNGGKCYLNDDTEGFWCACTPDYIGETCEESRPGSKM